MAESHATRSAATKAVWARPGEKERRSAISRLAMTPEVRARISAASVAACYRSDSERQRRREVAIGLWEQPEYRAAHAAAWAKKRDGMSAKERRRYATQKCRFSKLYGITVEDRERLYEEQGGVCAACFAFISLDSMPKKYRAAVDHDHVTGKVRGLLCLHCNMAEGLLRSNPLVMRRMADYIEAAHGA